MSGFGEVLKMIGEYGAFQKCLVVLLCIPSFLTPFHMFGQIFISIEVPHHCNTSWIRAISPNLTIQQELNLTIPKRMDDSLDECSRFTPVDSDIESIIKYGLNSTQNCEQGWVYPTKSVPTLVTEVCVSLHAFQVQSASRLENCIILFKSIDGIGAVFLLP